MINCELLMMRRFVKRVLNSPQRPLNSHGGGEALGLFLFAGRHSKMWDTSECSVEDRKFDRSFLEIKVKISE